MATFGDLRPDGDDEDETSSDDEEYLPENDKDADTDVEEEEDSGSEGSDGESAAVTSSRKANDRKKLPAKKRKREDNRVNKGEFAGRARRGGIRIESEVKEVSEKAEINAAAATDFSSHQQEPPKVAEQKKQRADALWSSFLSDVGGSSRPASSSAASAPSKSTTEPPPKPTRPAAAKTTKVFDFAGESVTVEVPAPVTAAAAASVSSKRPSAISGGVRGLLDSLAKRPKLSTLEKSRLDWETFKSREGIAEDLAAHNRGKAGFLERQAFLERADYRQFERERDARLASSKKSG